MFLTFIIRQVIVEAFTLIDEDLLQTKTKTSIYRVQMVAFL